MKAEVEQSKVNLFLLLRMRSLIRDQRWPQARARGSEIELPLPTLRSGILVCCVLRTPRTEVVLQPSGYSRKEEIRRLLWLIGED